MSKAGRAQDDAENDARWAEVDKGVCCCTHPEAQDGLGPCTSCWYGEHERCHSPTPQEAAPGL